MTLEQVIFILVSLLTVGTGIVVVTNRNLFHAALAMMASFLGVAGLYIMLDAGFLAAAQLLVYIGAISILIIFAIMLTRRMMQAREIPFNSQSGLGLFTAVGLFALLASVIIRWWGYEAVSGRPEVPDTILQGTVSALGQAFVNPGGYVIPFIMASVLLLAALIGSIYIAWPSEQTEDEA
ncbi:MAG: NADH-quinone oxidoreductase subunit J [Ardenticatenaceae bacterium]|nr:NADH-quinone oxidoreductase subunit J [Ardenticatenaceae bacterium]MCB8949787.1 NADH-quinone oxidoreductase subunit J [Ardenticatenaceae bacterium]